MHRYEWRKPSDLPDRLELIDRVTKYIIAEIVSIGRTWEWRRKTSLLLHGAGPAEGIAKGLTQAKVQVLDGLPE
jgi:hypothetical protein